MFWFICVCRPLTRSAPSFSPGCFLEIKSNPNSTHLHFGPTPATFDFCCFIFLPPQQKIKKYIQMKARDCNRVDSPRWWPAVVLESDAWWSPAEFECWFFCNLLRVDPALDRARSNSMEKFNRLSVRLVSDDDDEQVQVSSSSGWIAMTIFQPKKKTKRQNTCRLFYL